MIHQWSTIIGTLVLSYEEGDPLARVEDLVIHPDTGKIVALWVKPLTLSFRYGILLTDDIIAWKRHVYIKDERVIAEPEEVIKIADILARKTYFLGNRVRGESGKAYGRVFDVDFDDKTLYLRYLFVRKSFLFFKYQPRYFHFDQILHVSPDSIVVEEDDRKKEKAKDEVLVKEGQPVLDA